MNVKLTSEQEQIVQEELRSGHFRTAEEVIGGALEALRERGKTAMNSTGTVTPDEAVRDMLAFIDKHRVRLEDISVKELIHEGHRL
jgi:Arc/MetJ-type ribon-helix-helix transcriptional regulator